MLELFPSWYGALYAAAFWIGYMLLPRIAKYRSVQLTRDQWTYVVIYSALGVLVGGRLGYVLLYEPVYFLYHMQEVFQIWNGGMSSHGGFIGVGIALWIIVKRFRISLLALLDIITMPVAIGLALGRIGNFINQELYIGYGALLDVGAMLVIAGVCYAMLRLWCAPLSPIGERVRVRASRTGKPAPIPSFPPIGGKGAHVGIVIAIFLILYSISRFYLETIRVQEWPEIFSLTRGQLFTIPLLVLGLALFVMGRGSRKLL